MYFSILPHNLEWGRETIIRNRMHAKLFKYFVEYQFTMQALYLVDLLFVTCQNFDFSWVQLHAPHVILQRMQLCNWFFIMLATRVHTLWTFVYFYCSLIIKMHIKFRDNKILTKTINDGINDCCARIPKISIMLTTRLFKQISVREWNVSKRRSTHVFGKVIFCKWIANKKCCVQFVALCL